MIDAGHVWTEAEIKRLEKSLDREYATAKREMRKKLKEFNDKFAVKDAKKRKQLEDGVISKREYRKWREGQIYYSQFMQDKIDAYARDQLQVNRRAAEIINNSLKATYAENHNYATYEVEHAGKIDTGYTLYNRDSVGRLASRYLPHSKVDEAKDLAWNTRQMRSALMQGIMQGESIPKIANRLAKLPDTNESSAVRTARTLMTGAQNAGRQDAFTRLKDRGLKLQKMWVATLDSRTRPRHAMMDGETVPVDQEFSNGMMFPADLNGDPEDIYNCRCRMVSQFEGFEKDASDVTWRNTDHLEDESYEAWKERHRQTLEKQKARKKERHTDADRNR